MSDTNGASGARPVPPGNPTALPDEVYELLKSWVEKKCRAYNTKRSGARTLDQYRQGLWNTIEKRWEEIEGKCPDIEMEDAIRMLIDSMNAPSGTAVLSTAIWNHQRLQMAVVRASSDEKDKRLIMAEEYREDTQKLTTRLDEMYLGMQAMMQNVTDVIKLIAQDRKPDENKS